MKQSEIEKRIKNVKNIYFKIDQLFDDYGNIIPAKYRRIIKDKLLGDEEFKEMLSNIDNYRPPRLFMIGRTGVGKSSLINAIVGSYVAKVDNIRSCTDKPIKYEIKDSDDRVLLEILDSRGISESDTINKETTAEDDIINQVTQFNPDAILFVVGAGRRDAVKSDVEFIKKVSSEYSKINKIDLPTIVIVNRCDEIAPSREKVANEYSQNKLQNINEEVQYNKKIIVENGLKIVDIIAVSSLIDWKLKDGPEIDVSAIENLPEKDKANLGIAFDGRFKIEELYNILYSAIHDCEAKRGLRMAFRIEELARRLSLSLTHIMATVSAGIGALTLPLSDIYLLCPLQAILVLIIASLSGRDITFDIAKEFIASLAGVGVVGKGLQLFAKEVIKRIPAFGNVASATIASGGTEAVGNAAIKYYIEGMNIDLVKKTFNDEMSKLKDNK